MVQLLAAGSLTHWSGQALGIFCQPIGTTQREATSCEGDLGPASQQLQVGWAEVLLLHLDYLIEEKLTLPGYWRKLGLATTMLGEVGSSEGVTS